MRIILATIATATLTMAAPAMAGDTQRTVKVGYADLDLSTATGRTNLDRRLSAAIEQLCGSYASANGDEADRITRCRAEARGSIARQMDPRQGAMAVARR